MAEDNRNYGMEALVREKTIRFWSEIEKCSQDAGRGGTLTSVCVKNGLSFANAYTALRSAKEGKPKEVDVRTALSLSAGYEKNLGELLYGEQEDPDINISELARKRRGDILADHMNGRENFQRSIFRLSRTLSREDLELLKEIIASHRNV